jgi:hypothetical protein
MLPLFSIQPRSDPVRLPSLGPLKNVIYGEKVGNDKVTVKMKMWLRQTSENFYRQGMQSFASRWHKAIQKGRNCVEN